MKLKYICQYCSKEYTNKYVLNRHLKIHIEYKRKEYLWQCKYCSDKPIFKSRRLLQQHNKEIHANVNLRTQKLNNICQYCNTEIYSTISGFKNHEAMCIKNPNRRIMDYSACKTEEFRRKVSERMKEWHKLGIAPTFKNRKLFPHSYPENWLINFLKNDFNMIENVDYITEKPFYKYFLDFAWPEKRLCIEIDGAQHQRFDKLILNDAEKDKLLKEDGWKELRLKWGYIVKYTQDAIKLITNFLNEQGDITVPLYKSNSEIWEEKRKENELNGVLKDKQGKYCPRKLSEDQWLKRKEIILNSDVDLTKLGWKSEVERKTELTRREIINTVNHFLDLQELCYKRR